MDPMKSRRWIAAAALAAAVVFLVMVTGEHGPAPGAPAPVSSSEAVLATDGGPTDDEGAEGADAAQGADGADRGELIEALQGLLDALGVSADELGGGGNADCDDGQAQSGSDKSNGSGNGNGNGGGNSNAGGNGKSNAGGNGPTAGTPPTDEFSNSPLGLREAGAIQPLADVYSAAEQQFGGEVIGAKLLPDERDGWTYDLRIVTEDGYVHDVSYNAVTMALISVDGDPIE
jgi:uncharacterized membrane protein YkoI